MTAAYSSLLQLRRRHDLDRAAFEAQTSCPAHWPCHSASVARAMRLAVHSERKSACIHVHLHGQTLAWLDLSSLVIILFAVAVKSPIATVYESAHCALFESMILIARRSIPDHTAEDGHVICTAFR